MQPDANGELQLADAMNILSKWGRVAAMQLHGNRLDCGAVKGFVRANYLAAIERGLLTL